MPHTNGNGSLNGSVKPVSVNRPSVLSLSIKEKETLYTAYLPFLKNGGIFVPTAHAYSIGDEIFLVLELMDDPDKYPIAGTVAWVTPAGANQGKVQGIGVHFPESEEAVHLRQSIEKHISSDLHSGRRTHTL